MIYNLVIITNILRISMYIKAFNYANSIFKKKGICF